MATEEQFLRERLEKLEMAAEDWRNDRESALWRFNEAHREMLHFNAIGAAIEAQLAAVRLALELAALDKPKETP